MGYFSSKTDRLYLKSNPAEKPELYWVDIKRKLEEGDVRYRDSQTMKAHLSASETSATPEMQTDFELGAMRSATLERAIVAWNLDDDNGDVLPVNAETVARLFAEDSSYLFSEVNARNPQPKAAEKNV